MVQSNPNHDLYSCVLKHGIEYFSTKQVSDISAMLDDKNYKGIKEYLVDNFPPAKLFAIYSSIIETESKKALDTTEKLLTDAEEFNNELESIINNLKKNQRK